MSDDFETAEISEKRRESVFGTVDYLQKLYQNELQLLWQRSVFAASFLILIFTGYGSYILKLFEIVKDVDNRSCIAFKCLKCEIIDDLFFNVFSNVRFNIVCILLLSLSIILSYIWYLMARSSKACFEQYENALAATYKKYIDGKVYGSEFFRPEFGIKMPRSIFGAGAFSIGKLSVILPFVFICFATLLLIGHTMLLINYNCLRRLFEKVSCVHLVIVFLIVALTIASIFFIHSKSKSGWHLKKKHYID